MNRIKPWLDGLVTVLVVIAAVAVIWRQLIPRSETSPRKLVEEASGTIPAKLASITLGSGDVALVEFADFECPFCARHARDVEPMIRKTFVDTGLLRQIFVNLPLPNHPHARAASESALCAHMQGRFWNIYDVLFSDQQALDSKYLTQRALRLGLDEGAFLRCLHNGESREVLELQHNAARDLSVRSTPTFFVGIVQHDGSIALRRRLNGALPFNDFQSAILDVAPNQ